MNDIFFIADLHLGHSNILKYESRPFKDTYEQDEIFIENWNRIIKKQYFVYILGDVSFYPKEKTGNKPGNTPGNIENSHYEKADFSL